MHFVGLMFKGEWINKNYHFEKARVVNLCFMGGLNLY